MGFDLPATTFRSEAFARRARMLRSALGVAIAGYLEDPSIVEVMLNPDGRLWIDRLSGRCDEQRCPFPDRQRARGASSSSRAGAWTFRDGSCARRRTR
jgi:Flp pilus assembly CpaF family ATPase